jgi:hypothetical protein
MCRYLGLPVYLYVLLHGHRETCPITYWQFDHMHTDQSQTSEMFTITPDPWLSDEERARSAAFFSSSHVSSKRPRRGFVPR